MQSLFDDDLYKFTMQQAVLKLYPDAVAEYRFINRGPHRFGNKFLRAFEDGLSKLAELKATDDELEKISQLPFIRPGYLECLRNYRYDLSEISEYNLTDDNNFALSIKAPWHSGILWEVKLMAMISEAYFKLEFEEGKWSMDGQKEKLHIKTNKLASANCKYADFGTRRRRNYEIQDLLVNEFKRYHHFVGTSNVHLAFKHNVRPIGTMAHEWVQGISALESLNHANRVMLKRWEQVYDSDLGIALTDTFGTPAFFKDFSMRYSKLFDGVRHDSGDPFKFADNVVAHYILHKINPNHKTIVFSDGLNADLAVKIKQHCDALGINCSFGIGTAFTNDFETAALNMVIKLWRMNGFPVVKLSDNAGKASGEPKAVEVVKSIYDAAA